MKGPDTFGETVLRYRGLLFSVCRRYSRDGLAVDDLMQEVLVALWQRREQMADIAVEPRRAVWIWRVARSRCIDLQRTSPLPSPLPEDHDTEAEDTAQRDALYELIAQLPEPDRTIVTLHLEGYEYREIGRKVGMSKNNVGVRLMRIKERLKEQWND